MSNRAGSFGLDAELAQKRAAQYDPQLENEARAWIEAVTGLSISGDFHEELKSGVVLCELINKIKPGSVKKINKMKMPFMQMENINAYLQACQNIGMPVHDTFMTVDLFEAQNMNAVINQIHALGRQAQKIGYAGPKLGVKLADQYERNFDEKKVKEAAAAVPILTAHTNEGQRGMGAPGARREIGGADPHKQ
eukprot:GCRY01000348.1.p1 GENE.GCRY01000348.1~~GCRY01000348.1.p1  ORF type:complete len:193 (+),score=36.16 GCRY01000348.1:86-664(+)